MTYSLHIIIRLEARLPPNAGFILRGNLAVFTRSANSVKSKPIWMKFGALWVHCWWLALTDFGRDPRNSDSLRGRRNFVFCQVNNAWFRPFPVWQIMRHPKTKFQRRATSRRHNYSLQIAKNSLQNDPSTGCLDSIFIRIKLGFGWILDLPYGAIWRCSRVRIDLDEIWSTLRTLLGLAIWQILSAIRAVATIWQAGDILFFLVH